MRWMIALAFVACHSVTEPPRAAPVAAPQPRVATVAPPTPPPPEPPPPPDSPPPEPCIAVADRCAPDVTWDRRPPRACIAADKLWAPPIEFKPNKYTIVRESFVVLDGVVELLLRYPELPAIEIQGHLAEPTEPRGGSLSEERAEAVEDYLVAHGIEPARIRTKGFGQDVPIADTRLEASRRLNRRIELVFVHPLLQRTCE